MYQWGWGCNGVDSPTSLEGFVSSGGNLEQSEIRGPYSILLMCTTKSLRKAPADARECEWREFRTSLLHPHLWQRTGVSP
jgi:hypothetical protein